MVRVRKIALMGYPSVGKSSLAVQFVEGRFEEDYSTTIENQFSKEISVSGRDYELQLFDTMGVTELPNFPDEYLVMDGWIIVYSVTARRSFEVVKEIYNRLRDANINRLPLVIVGNKSDLESDREVSREEGEALAQACKAIYTETSAKDNVNVLEAFRSALFEIEKYSGEPLKGKENCQIL
eukprot:m.40354 g.40354  ORF g.40354 m.40354 type:complete len:181 (-) comp5997_c0_seq1:310-852(-)